MKAQSFMLQGYFLSFIFKLSQAETETHAGQERQSFMLRGHPHLLKLALQFCILRRLPGLCPQLLHLLLQALCLLLQHSLMLLHSRQRALLLLIGRPQGVQLLYCVGLHSCLVFAHSPATAPACEKPVPVPT